MLRKVTWILASLLMVLSLVIASCGPQELAVQTPTSQTTPTTQATQTSPAQPTGTGQTPTADSELPQYGGTIRVPHTSTVIDWDEGFAMTVTLGGFTHNEPAEGDWAKGPEGTQEADWTYSGCDRINLKAGAVIESWDIPEAGHIVFHVRQGIHFSLDPSNEASKLVGGREMTAEDIAYSLNRLCTTPRAYLHNAYPRIAQGAVITAPDKWTVDIQVPVSEFADAHAQFFDRNHIVAHEVVEKYGDANDR